MSMLSIGRSGNGKAAQPRVEPPVPPPPPPQEVERYAPKRHAGPHQLGNATLQNLDQITTMSAEEIDRVADQLLEAAHETADILHEAARRVRHSGLVANERLANYVRVATTCADAARMMANTVELRDQPQPEQPAPAEAAEASEAIQPANAGPRAGEPQANPPSRARVDAETGLPTDLDAIAREIETVGRRAAGLE